MREAVDGSPAAEAEGTMMGPTPLEKLSRLGSMLGIDLRAKRDDLLPMPGGGNKVRKVLPIIRSARRAGYTALVTTGGVHSNHARVTALAAAALGMRCRLVLHGDPAEMRDPAGNLLLMRLVGARATIVPAESIASTIADEVHALEAEGERPLELPGGGHCLAGALAYAEAVDELGRQCGRWTPDVIVLASGTGTTQAGIVAGVTRRAWRTRVVGISVARPRDRGAPIVEAATREVLAEIDSEAAFDPSCIDFRDDWTCGGYERVDHSIVEAVSLAAREEALTLDPTYTGKSFAGLVGMVRSREVSPGERVLFWHTGGLLNLLAAPPQLRRQLLAQ